MFCVGTIPAEIPDKFDPSPSKEDAVITPVFALIPATLIVTAEPTTTVVAVITPVALIPPEILTPYPVVSNFLLFL